MRVIEDFDVRAKVVADHLVDAHSWDEDTLVAHPIQVLIKGAQSAMHRCGLDAMSVAEILNTDMVAGLSPATRRLLLWAFMARGVDSDMQLMGPLVCVMHSGDRVRMSERVVDVPGKFATFVMHVQDEESRHQGDGRNNRHRTIVLRGYRAAETSSGLQIGGAKLMAFSKRILSTPTISADTGAKETPLYVSLREAWSYSRLDVANKQLFDSALRMLVALRAAAAYRRVTRKLSAIAERRGTTVSGMCQSDAASDDVLCAMRTRDASQRYFIERSTICWQRFVRGYGKDDIVPPEHRLECRGALGPCIPYSAGSGGIVYEDLTPVVATASQHLYNGRVISEMSPNHDGSWSVQLHDSVERVMVTARDMARGHSRGLVPQVLAVDSGAVYRGYAPAPSQRDLQFTTPDGVPVDLYWTGRDNER